MVTDVQQDITSAVGPVSMWGIAPAHSIEPRHRPVHESIPQEEPAILVGPRRDVEIAGIPGASFGSSPAVPGGTVTGMM